MPFKRFIGDVAPEELFDSAAFEAAQNKLNKVAEEWGIDRAKKMLDYISQMGIVDTGRLFQRLKVKLGYDFGEVNRIGFGFPRYGIMVEKGVGRGHPIESVAGNGAALGERVPKPWFSKSLDDEAGIAELADLIAEIKADMTVSVVGIGKKTSI